MRPGDDVIVLPCGLMTTITRIEQHGRDIDAAYSPISVTLHLRDDLDAARGDVICLPSNRPAVSQDLDAMVCRMSDKPLQLRGRYALKHTTRWTRAVITELLYRLDVKTGHCDETSGTSGSTTSAASDSARPRPSSTTGTRKTARPARSCSWTMRQTRR